MVHVSSAMWRMKKRPSNFVSCSDNALRLLILVAGILYWGLQGMSSLSIWDCVLKWCFEGGIFWRPTSRLKGIEDFDLEHCSWSCVLEQFHVGSHLNLDLSWKRFNWCWSLWYQNICGLPVNKHDIWEINFLKPIHRTPRLHCLDPTRHGWVLDPS